MELEPLLVIVAALITIVITAGPLQPSILLFSKYKEKHSEAPEPVVAPADSRDTL